MTVPATFNPWLFIIVLIALVIISTIAIATIDVKKHVNKIMEAREKKARSSGPISKLSMPFYGRTITISMRPDEDPHIVASTHLRIGLDTIEDTHQFVTIEGDTVFLSPMPQEED